MNNESNGNSRAGRIEFLKQKLEADRVALAQAMAEQARRKQRDDAKLFAHVGRAVCQAAKQSPDFHATVKQNISPVFADESDKMRRWLTDRGWL